MEQFFWLVDHIDDHVICDYFKGKAYNDTLVIEWCNSDYYLNVINFIYTKSDYIKVQLYLNNLIYYYKY